MQQADLIVSSNCRANRWKMPGPREWGPSLTARGTQVGQSCRHGCRQAAQRWCGCLQADLIVSNDCHANRWKMPGPWEGGTSPNLGLAWLRNTPQTQNLMDMWLDCRSDNATDFSWDQLCFKQVHASSAASGSWTLRAVLEH